MKNVRVLMLLLILLSIFFGLNINTVNAHPGRTASDGCHYCRTNCDEWGVAWNARHCHGGNTAPTVKQFVPSEPAKQYIAPTKKPTPTPTRTPTPTKKPTPTNKPTNTPTPTIEPTNTPIPTSVNTKAPTPTTIKEVKEADTEKESSGFWGFIKSLINKLF